MTGVDDFHAQYIAALHTYLHARDEDSLTVGYELGRRALEEKISVLDIIEQHARTTFAISEDPRIDAPVALEFLLQTLAPLDVATRGFSTAPSGTRNNGLAPKILPTATHSGRPW